MERETVIIDLPATTGPEVRPVNRNYVARFARLLDLDPAVNAAAVYAEEVEL